MKFLFECSTRYLTSEMSSWTLDILQTRSFKTMCCHSFLALKRASDMSAADWLSQTYVKNYRNFSRMVIRFTQRWESLYTTPIYIVNFYHRYVPWKYRVYYNIEVIVLSCTFFSVHSREWNSTDPAKGDFRVHLSLHLKARPSAKSLLWISVFIHIEIRTNYHNKNFAPRLAPKERLMETRKWAIWSVEIVSSTRLWRAESLPRGSIISLAVL